MGSDNGKQSVERRAHVVKMEEVDQLYPAAAAEYGYGCGCCAVHAQPLLPRPVWRTTHSFASLRLDPQECLRRPIASPFQPFCSVVCHCGPWWWCRWWWFSVLCRCRCRGRDPAHYFSSASAREMRGNTISSVFHVVWGVTSGDDPQPHHPHP